MLVGRRHDPVVAVEAAVQHVGPTCLPVAEEQERLPGHVEPLGRLAELEDGRGIRLEHHVDGLGLGSERDGMQALEREPAARMPGRRASTPAGTVEQEEIHVELRHVEGRFIESQLVQRQVLRRTTSRWSTGRSYQWGTRPAPVRPPAARLDHGRPPVEAALAVPLPVQLAAAGEAPSGPPPRSIARGRVARTSWPLTSTVACTTAGHATAGSAAVASLTRAWKIGRPAVEIARRTFRSA